MPKLNLIIGSIDSPIAPRLAPRPERQKPGRKSTYSPETIAAAERCHAKGVSLADTASLLGLTVEQVKYLRYVRPNQVAGANPSPTRGKDKAPLHELVPDPITERHLWTSENHRWLGERTRYRDDVIRQVKSCRGKGHSLIAVGRHFGLASSAVRYIWYQLPDEEKNPTD